MHKNKVNIFRTLETTREVLNYTVQINSTWTSVDCYILNNLFKIPYSFLQNGIKTVQDDVRRDSG